MVVIIKFLKIMSLCIADMIRMIEGLGFSSDEIVKCLNRLAADHQLTSVQICERVMEDLQRVADTCQERAKKHKMELRPHQRAMVNHMIRNPGGIAVFDVGTGKSLSAVMTIVCGLRLAELFGHPDIPVNIVTPASLQDNMKKEMKAIGIKPTDKRFHFYTPTGYSKAYKRNTIQQDHAILIIDEAHEYRKDYKGQYGINFGLKNPEEYQVDAVIESSKRAWRRLLLTATPMYAHDYDMANLVTMARGKELHPDEYFRAWTSPQLLTETFGNLFMFQGADQQFYPKVDEVEIRIPMTLEYFRQYMRVEKNIREPGQGEQKSNAFYTKLRRFTNTIQPPLKMPKVEEILLKREPTLFYSEFLDSGADLLEAAAQKHEVPYRVISGKTPKAKRQEYVNLYNSGEVTLLILTKAAGQGLDTKGTRHIILLEKGWTRASEIQIIGRGVRYKSHWHLPKDQQQVTVWHLMIVKPPRQMIQSWVRLRQISWNDDTGKPSVDEYMYNYNRKVYIEHIIPKMRQLKSVEIPH